MEWEKVCWDKIWELKTLLRLLITPYERHDLVMRAAALNLIAGGKSYRQIGDELWLSPQTISSIKKIFEEKAYKSYSERSKKERKRKKYSFSATTFKSRPAGISRPTKYGTIYMP